MILILGAMSGEIAAFLEHIDGALRHEPLPGLSIHDGTLEQQAVTVARSGVGKAMSALSCQCIIDFLSHKNKRPGHIIFTGLAGAINPVLEIGDTLVASDCVQHDLDASALGIPRGTVPDSPYRFLEADRELFEAAMSYKPREGTIHSGRILTGDQFIADRSSDYYRYLSDELEGDGVEMEGAAVALCAAVNNIPFLLLRTISDEADGNAKVQFREFMPQASKNSLEAVRHILRTMAARRNQSE